MKCPNCQSFNTRFFDYGYDFKTITTDTGVESSGIVELKCNDCKEIFIYFITDL
jgi:phage FluMu protein Com